MAGKRKIKKLVKIREIVRKETYVPEHMQRHHASYDPEILIPIARKEHFAIMKLQRYKHVSWGFPIALIFEAFRLIIRKLEPTIASEFVEFTDDKKEKS